MHKIVKNNTPAEIRATVATAKGNPKPTKHIHSQSVSHGAGQKIRRPSNGGGKK